MKSSLPKGIALALGLSAALLAAPMEPSELATLRTKALNGNVLAQYNLGRYYSDSSSGAMDRAEAFMWLKLAAENGTGSLELVKLTEEMSPAELGEGRRRLDQRRGQMRRSSEAETQESVVLLDAQQKYSAEREQLAASVRSLTSELAAMRAEQAKAGGSPERLRAELTKAEAGVRNLQLRVQQLEDLAAERGRTLESVRSDLEQAKTAAIKASTDAGDAAVASAERDALGKQVLALQEELGKAQASVARAEEDARNAVRAQAEQLVAEQKRTAAAEAEVAASKAELASARAAAAGKQTEATAQLRERVLQLEQANAELLASKSRQALPVVDPQLAKLASEKEELAASLEAAKAEVAALTGQQKRLSAELEAATARGADASQEARVAQAQALAKAEAAVEAAKASAAEAAKAYEQATSEAEKARQEAKQLAVRNQQLEDLAAERGRAVTQAKEELAQLRKPVADTNAAMVALSSDRDALAAQVASLREELRVAKDSESALKSEVALARAEASAKVGDELAQARERVQHLEQDNAELNERLKAVPAPVATGADSEALKSQLAEVESKLSTALRSYTLLQQELDTAREQATKVQGELADKAAALQAQVAALTTQLEAVRTESSGKDAQVAEATRETAQQRQAALTQGVENTNLRDQLRQTQAQLVLVIEENTQLKTKLAVIAPPPASSLGTPTRPGTAAAQAAITLPATLTQGGRAKPTAPALASAPAAPAPTPAPAPEVRTHVVREGDSLHKISRRYYGTTERWQEIFEANRNILSSPERLPLGASLRIP